MYEVSVRTTFEAAHRLADADTPAYNAIHGHSFVVIVAVAAPSLGAEGWVVDLEALQRTAAAIAGRLDHCVLNDVEGLGAPTCENILTWFDRQLVAEGVSASHLIIERPTLGQRVVYAPRRTG